MLLLCLSASCQEVKELDPTPREFDQKMTLVPTDTLTIPIGHRSDVYSRYVKASIINNIPYLGVVNVNTNDLEFYALSDKGEDFKVRFHLDGPNAVGQLKAFEVISDSTLFIASSYRIRLYVTDFEGNLKKTIETHDTSRNGKPFVQMYYTQSPLVYHKDMDDFYVFTRVDTDYFSPGIWSGTMFLKIQNRDDESITHMFELPSRFNKYVYSGYFSHSSHVLVDDRHLVFGVPFYNNILVYDLEKETLIERKAGSKHFGDALPWDNPDMGRDEEFYVTSNSYRELAYDEQNKLLYRLAYRKVDYIGPNGQQRNWDNKLPSVVILDSNFKKVGEVDLPKNTIHTRMYFTHNGKLYLSLNHPDNNPSEDEMVFVGFKPEKL